MNHIRMLVFDIDGVITDGKRYISESGETKTVSLKDLDAFGMLRDAGYRIGCISGEDTPFSRSLAQTPTLDYARIGCKRKMDAIGEIGERFGIRPEQISYIGDGKYDIPVLEAVGLGLCPADAIEEVKRAADIVLRRKGGEGCIAECYTLLEARKQRSVQIDSGSEASRLIQERMAGHRTVFEALAADGALCSRISVACEMISACYRSGGSVFFCGNGDSAADAQYLVAELVGRFYLQRPPLRAEALMVNTSVLTALSSDHDLSTVFACQLEGRAKKGDVLVGITTSGTSSDILQAFRVAKQLGLRTVLMTGDIREEAEILSDTDCLLNVPSRDTHRIQEMHILMGHIICEAVEKAAVTAIEKERP